MGGPHPVVSAPHPSLQRNHTQSQLEYERSLLAKQRKVAKDAEEELAEHTSRQVSLEKEAAAAQAANSVVEGEVTTLTSKMDELRQQVRRCDSGEGALRELPPPHRGERMQHSRIASYCMVSKLPSLKDRATTGADDSRGGQRRCMQSALQTKSTAVDRHMTDMQRQAVLSTGLGHACTFSGGRSGICIVPL